MRTILSAICSAAILLCACTKDENSTACQQLEGHWHCTSWMEDEEQFLGDTIFILSSEIEFKKLDGHQGDIEWSISYLIGGSETIIGSYVVNESCDEVTITPKAGSSTTYSFSFNGETLVLISAENNVDIEMRYLRQ